MSDDLIKRLENATGPDRELDLAIHIAAIRCDPTAQYYPNGNCLSYYEYHPEVPGGANEFLTEELPHYTASIDAALTLVPEGYCWSRVPGRVEIVKEEHYGDPFVEPYSSNARWITIALCIAALRARAAIAAKTETAT